MLTPRVVSASPSLTAKINNPIASSISNNIATVYPSDDALDVLSDALSMDSSNVSNRNDLQRSWLEQVMEYNSAEAVKNRDFQARENAINRQLSVELSNSAYSRAIADLKKSGLNPYFALAKGLSASTPFFGSASGSAASVSTPNAISQSDIMSSYTSIFNNLVNNAFSNKKLTVDSALKLSEAFLDFLK